MTETQTHPAAGFDVEAWLQDAKMPEESATVYKRADVIGELTALQERIAIQRKAAEQTEKTAGDSAELTELEKQYDALVETFTGSQLTIYARALSPDEKRELRGAHEKRVANLTPVRQNEEYGYDLLAAAIVAVRPLDGDRVPVQWSPAQVRKIENTIGETQMREVLAAHQIAQNKLPAVDADFLHRPSGEGNSPE